MPLVSRFPGLRRLVRNFTRPFPGGVESAYDAVLEVWFDDAETMRAAFASPAGRAEVADAPNFLDMSAFQLLVVQEDDVPLTAAKLGPAEEPL